jgi:hypothetical protein
MRLGELGSVAKLERMTSHPSIEYTVQYIQVWTKIGHKAYTGQKERRHMSAY